MVPTPNPPDFEEAVRAHLEPVRTQFNYEQMLHTFLSVERFRAWAGVVDRYRPVAGARFLSSGCGYAGSLLAYRDAGAIQVTGVEVDPQYVRFGRLRVRELPDAAVLHTDGGRLPFPDRSFDVIESMDVIEHTEDPGAYLRELTRLLSDDGVILVVTPNRLWPVEQHLHIVGPPWLPVGVGDRLFGGLSRLPRLSEERAFRYAELEGMRTRNVSMRRLRALARRHRLFLQVPPASTFGDGWPIPHQAAWIERLAAHRYGCLAAPVRTLVAVLGHDHRRGVSSVARDTA